MNTIEHFEDTTRMYEGKPYVSQPSTYNLPHEFVLTGTDTLSDPSEIFGIDKRTWNFMDFINLLIFGGGAIAVMIYVIEEGGAFGYLMTVAGIIIMCAIFIVN